jgi:FixJ family two-component response regulator
LLFSWQRNGWFGLEMPLISIVDDDESVREAVGGLLKALGFDTEVFASAENFLRSDHAEFTACVITDLQMREMSGLELQARLARDGHAMPVIFITAFPNDQIRARALKGGAVCFLNKPFTEAELVAGISSALERRPPQCAR